MSLFDCVVHRILLLVFPTELVLVSDTQNCILPVPINSSELILRDVHTVGVVVIVCSSDTQQRLTLLFVF
jgi:hypothetical protein